MSPECSWEQLTAEVDRDIVFQEKYLVIPTFEASTLIDYTRPILSKAQELVSGKEYQSGIRTNISQVEIIYPFLLQKAGLLSEDIPQWALTEKVNEGAIRGTELHKADAIFSVILHGIRGNLLRSYLPTFSTDEVDRLNFALEDVDVSKNSSEEEIRDNLIIGWSRYRSILGPEEFMAVPLPGFGIVDPRKEKKYEKSGDVDEQVFGLANAWAREIKSSKPMTWEFLSGPEDEVINQREVLAVIKFLGPNLQFVSKLDSVVRKKMSSGKVQSQHVDFKTGQREIRSILDAEIRKRQAQIMRIIVEKFTSKYLTNFRSLRQRDNAFVMKAMHDSKALGERVNLAGNRYIDQQTGEMSFERAGFRDEAERTDFNLWLAWYGIMIHFFRYEIKDLISRKPNYKLSGIELSEEALERLYKDN